MFLLAAVALAAAALAAPPVRVAVVAPPAVAPGATARVAVVLEVPRGWHIYWDNPGQSGLPTDVSLTAPGLVVSAPRSPTPTRIVTDGIVNYGYTGTVGFVFDVTAPTVTEPDARVPLAATASWLLCHDICVPGSADARGGLAVSAAPTRRHDPVAAYVVALPSPFAASGGTVSLDGGALRVTLPGPGPFDVFPSQALEAAWAPTLVVTDGTLVLTSPLPAVPAGARIVLSRGPEHTGFFLDLPESK